MFFQPRYFARNPDKFSAGMTKVYQSGDFLDLPTMEEFGRKVCKEEYDVSDKYYKYNKLNCFKTAYMYGILYLLEADGFEPTNEFDWTLGALLSAKN